MVDSYCDWDSVIDLLIEWGFCPEAFAPEDPPLKSTLSFAIKLCQRFRDENDQSPDDVYISADGSVVFVVKLEKNWRMTCMVFDNGEVEYNLFHGKKLVQRDIVEVEKKEKTEFWAESFKFKD